MLSVLQIRRLLGGTLVFRKFNKFRVDPKTHIFFSEIKRLFQEYLACRKFVLGRR